MPGKIEVQNVPTYAREHKFWVARIVDSKAWFYGAWDNELRANSIAKEIGGLVVVNDMEF